MMSRSSSLSRLVSEHRSTVKRTDFCAWRNEGICLIARKPHALRFAISAKARHARICYEPWSLVNRILTIVVDYGSLRLVFIKTLQAYARAPIIVLTVVIRPLPIRAARIARFRTLTCARRTSYRPPARRSAKPCRSERRESRCASFSSPWTVVRAMRRWLRRSEWE